VQTRIRLFSFAGIPLYVHGMLLWCLGLLSVFLLVSSDDLGAVGWTLVGAALTLICVAIHEVGHALAARALGVEVYDVVLHVMFGMTRMEPPGSARREIAIGCAGPLANLACAAALYPLVKDGTDWGHEVPHSPLSVAFAVNLVLGGLNLIPAFPMDGGRLMRAFLSLHVGDRHATRIAVVLGRVIAVGMIMSPIALGFVAWSLAIPIVGFLILFLGEAEWRRLLVVDEARRVGKFLDLQAELRDRAGTGSSVEAAPEPPSDQPSN